MKIPQNFKGVLWSSPPEALDLKKDKTYIIHQVLRYGTLDQIKWLMKTYKKATVREVFSQHPRKIYSKQSFNFMKNILLDLKDLNLDRDDYIQNYY